MLQKRSLQPYYVGECEMKKFTILLAFVCVQLCLCSTSVFAATTSCSLTDDTKFVPSWGKVLIDEDRYSRYVYQWMYWHNDSRLSWFGDNTNSTFEPDAFFYNYNNEAFAEEPTGYWASNLPRAYRDTQSFDSSGENAITIGSANAQDLSSGRIYYTVTRMTDGGGDSSWVKLSAQRGKRRPSWCYSTNCSFGCRQSENNVRTLPFRQSVPPLDEEFSAPGCVQYWYHWNITTFSEC